MLNDENRLGDNVNEVIEAISALGYFSIKEINKRITTISSIIKIFEIIATIITGVMIISSFNIGNTNQLLIIISSTITLTIALIDIIYHAIIKSVFKNYLMYFMTDTIATLYHYTHDIECEDIDNIHNTINKLCCVYTEMLDKYM